MEIIKIFIRKFFDKEEISDYETSAINDRIVDIRARIAAIKSRNGWDEESYQNITPSKKLPETSGVHTSDTPRHNERTTNEAEMMALKAKLLGKKQ